MSKLNIYYEIVECIRFGGNESRKKKQFIAVVVVLLKKVKKKIENKLDYKNPLEMNRR